MSTQQGIKQARPIETIRISRYLIGGKQSTRAELIAQPFVVAGAGLPEKGTAYGFADESSLGRWAAGTNHADVITRILEAMKRGQRLEGTDEGAQAVKSSEANFERVRDELEAISRKNGVGVGSFLGMAGEGNPPGSGVPLSPIPLLFDRVDDPGTLTEPPVFGGSVFPVIATIPTFFRFNDKASGAFVPGVCTLFDKTFVRGAARVLLGFPFSTFVLADLDFDNRAASGIAI
jgi:hypothetical protein